MHACVHEGGGDRVGRAQRGETTRASSTSSVIGFGSYSEKKKGTVSAVKHTGKSSVANADLSSPETAQSAKGPCRVAEKERSADVIEPPPETGSAPSWTQSPLLPLPGKGVLDENRAWKSPYLQKQLSKCRTLPHHREQKSLT